MPRVWWIMYDHRRSWESRCFTCLHVSKMNGRSLGSWLRLTIAPWQPWQPLHASHALPGGPPSRSSRTWTCRIKRPRMMWRRGGCLGCHGGVVLDVLGWDPWLCPWTHPHGWCDGNPPLGPITVPDESGGFDLPCEFARGYPLKLWTSQTSFGWYQVLIGNKNDKLSFVCLLSTQQPKCKVSLAPL